MSELFMAEPMARYWPLPPLVADASVLAALLFDEPEKADAEAALIGRQLFAPLHLPQEIASVALKKMRRKHCTPEDAARKLLQLSECDIEYGEVRIAEAFALAHDYGLTIYDAAYLWLAHELQAPLITFDAQLAQAALRHLSGPRA